MLQNGNLILWLMSGRMLVEVVVVEIGEEVVGLKAIVIIVGLMGIRLGIVLIETFQEEQVVI